MSFKTFSACCLLKIALLASTSVPFPINALSPFGSFYDTFLCEEKAVLFSVGLSTLCKCSGCGAVPYPSNTGFVTPEPIIESQQVWSFVSEPNLHPMKISVNKFDPGTSSGYIFLASYGFSDEATYGQNGTLILDNYGTPFWFRPQCSPNVMNTDFRVQNYKGKPVLTFWQGTLATPPAYTNVPGGSSEPGSCYYILDNTYNVIKTLSARGGFTSDIHEFLLTPSNTALFLSTQAVPMDLTPYGGPADGYVQDFAIQEIDLDTNKLIFFWDALEHIPLSESYEPASNAVRTGNIWDAYHLNSIGLTNTIDDIIVSSRSMWTIYRINKPTKNIVWQLGGKSSDFTIELGGEFSWQHDARFLSYDLVSLFDDNSDGSSTSEPPSHGLILQLDFNTMNANVYRTYFHDPNITVDSQGNLQTLPNTNKFVGWGQSQYYSEFTDAGNNVGNPSLNMVYDAQMPSTNYTYRAYRHDWVGMPFYPPSIGLTQNGAQVTVYASWNGSTETTQWQVFAGPSEKKMTLVASVGKSGFETAINVDNPGPYYQVKALDVMGTVIGVSKALKK